MQAEETQEASAEAALRADREDQVRAFGCACTCNMIDSQCWCVVSERSFLRRGRIRLSGDSTGHYGFGLP